MSWSIYENAYDLSVFIGKHPGGEEILAKTKDMGDITALFESYHAFSTICTIRTSLEKYRVQGASGSGEQYGFTTYNKLAEMIKEQHKFNRRTMKATSVKYLYILFSNRTSHVHIVYICVTPQLNYQDCHGLLLRAALD